MGGNALRRAVQPLLRDWEASMLTETQWPLWVQALNVHGLCLHSMTLAYLCCCPPACATARVLLKARLPTPLLQVLLDPPPAALAKRLQRRAAEGACQGSVHLMGSWQRLPHRPLSGAHSSCSCLLTAKSSSHRLYLKCASSNATSLFLQERTSCRLLSWSPN